jgi:hypothetical protein
VNAKESLAADRAADIATERAIFELGGDSSLEYQQTCALVAIALELRAARVYANYLEGRGTSRMGSNTRSKRVPSEPES